MRSNSFKSFGYGLTAGGVFGFQADIKGPRFQTGLKTAMNIVYQPKIFSDIIHQAGGKTAATQDVIHDLKGDKNPDWSALCQFRPE